MKGKNHVITGILFLITLLLIDVLIGNNLINLILKQNVYAIFFMFYLFFAGILLPDSDKIGSWIYKFFLPLAVTSWLIGFIISAIKRKKFKHRGFLHSTTGIIITSISSSIICFLFLLIFFKINIEILIIFIISTLTGQILHLVFD